MSAYRLFPPRSEHVAVPISSRAAAKAGLSLYTPSRLRGVVARRLVWALVDVVGPRAVPGTPADWSPPMDAETWQALSRRWVSNVGEFDQVAVHERRQASRDGFAVLLLRAGRAVAFAKLRVGGDFGSEVQALRLLESNPQSVFEVPRFLDEGAEGRWAFVLTTALKPVLHRVPKRPRLAAVTQAIEDALEGLSRNPETPGHWVPMHGDLTPWNLRESPRGTLSLIDWEDAAWGPPGADEVLYRVAIAAIRGCRFIREPRHEEAIRFWTKRLQARQEVVSAARDADRWLLDAMLQRLRGRSREAS